MKETASTEKANNELTLRDLPEGSPYAFLKDQKELAIESLEVWFINDDTAHQSDVNSLGYLSREGLDNVTQPKGSIISSNKSNNNQNTYQQDLETPVLEDKEEEDSDQEAPDHPENQDEEQSEDDDDVSEHPSQGSQR